MATRKLEVEIIGDSRSLERAFSRAQKSSQQFGNDVTGRVAKVDGALQKLGAGRAALIGGFAGAGAGIIAPKVIDQVNAAVTAASDLNEQITKNQQVFGSSAAAVEAWSKTTAKSIGISQSAALEATGTFGNLFTAIGVAGPAAADTSRRLVQLAADLASFNNASPEDTLDAIRSGLIGEAEPLRRFGVLLSETRVQQVAMAQTGKTSAASLTAQEKAAARVAIIFKDTAKAQGDFARTSTGLANTQRLLNARLQDTQAQLGKTVAPIKNQLIHFLIGAADATNKFADALRDLAAVPAINKVITYSIVPKGKGGGQGSTKGGFSVGDLLKANIFDIAKLGVDAARGTGPFAAKDTFDENAAAKQFAARFDTIIEALERGKKEGLANVNKAAAVTGADVKASKGFGSGLTPKDLFGTLVKDVPQALQDKLLDAQLSDAGPKAIRSILEQQQQALVKALDDPRLKAKGIRQIKTALKGVKDAIASEDATITQGVTDAANARQQRIDDAKQRAQDAAARQRASWDNLFALLQLQFDQAEVTKAFADDIAKSKALERAILARIKVEGRTPELLDRLFQQRQTTAKKIADQEQARQFRVLGLDVEGNKPPPGIANLKKQLAQLSSRNDLSRNAKGLLKRIREALIDPIHKATPETRDAIKGLFDTIRSEFDKGTKATGPLTKTTSLNTKAALANVTGLNRDQIKQIRANLSSFNSAGVALAGSQTGQPITVHTSTTVNLDGEKVARNTTRHQQKAARRNPPQKRGPNRHGGF